MSSGFGFNTTPEEAQWDLQGRVRHFVRRPDPNAGADTLSSPERGGQGRRRRRRRRGDPSASPENILNRRWNALPPQDGSFYENQNPPSDLGETWNEIPELPAGFFNNPQGASGYDSPPPGLDMSQGSGGRRNRPGNYSTSPDNMLGQRWNAFPPQQGSPPSPRRVSPEPDLGETWNEIPELPAGLFNHPQGASGYDSALALNQTFEGPPPGPPALNQTFERPPPGPPALNQTFEGPPPGPPALNQTFEGPPPGPPALNQTFEGPPPGPPALNQTFQRPPPALNQTFQRPPPALNQTYRGPPRGLNRTFQALPGPPVLNRTYPRPAPALNQTYQRPALNQTFQRPPPAFNQTFQRPPRAPNQTFQAPPGPRVVNYSFPRPPEESFGSIDPFFFGYGQESSEGDPNFVVGNVIPDSSGGEEESEDAIMIGEVFDELMRDPGSMWEWFSNYYWRAEAYSYLRRQLQSILRYELPGYQNDDNESPEELIATLRNLINGLVEQINEIQGERQGMPGPEADVAAAGRASPRPGPSGAQNRTRSPQLGSGRSSPRPGPSGWQNRSRSPDFPIQEFNPQLQSSPLHGPPQQAQLSRTYSPQPESFGEQSRSLSPEFPIAEFNPQLQSSALHGPPQQAQLSRTMSSQPESFDEQNRARSPQAQMNRTFSPQPGPSGAQNRAPSPQAQMNRTFSPQPGPSGVLGRTAGPSLGRLVNRFDVGTTVKMNTTYSGSPDEFQQRTTVDSSAPAAGAARIADAPVNLNTTAIIAPRAQARDDGIWNRTVDHFRRRLVLESPGRSPLLLDIDVQPQIISGSPSGEHVLCDIALDMREPEGEALPGRGCELEAPVPQLTFRASPEQFYDSLDPTPQFYDSLDPTPQFYDSLEPPEQFYDSLEPPE